MTPTLVPCRLRLDSVTRESTDIDEVDSGKRSSNDPEPLHSLLNPLVGSQDPIDAFLITKVDIHQVSSCSSSSTSEEATLEAVAERTSILQPPSPCESGGLVVKDNEYVLMINNNSSVPHDIISNQLLTKYSVILLWP